MTEATFIEDKITRVSLAELGAAMFDGHRKVMGSDFVSASSMAAAFAQLCLESGNGEKAHHFCFHNEKRGADWAGLYTRYECDEIFDARTTAIARGKGLTSVSLWHGGPLYRVYLYPPHPWTEFTAFESAIDGAARYIEFLSCRDRYRDAWHALRTGDAFAFSHELRKAGYYTADEVQYTKGLVSIAKRSLPLCDKILAQEAHELDDDYVANVTAISQATLAHTIWAHDRHQELAA